MDNRTTLIDSFFIPDNLEKTQDVYEYVHKIYKRKPYIFYNNIRVFGPFPEPSCSWDISEEQKIAIYNNEVKTVLRWINENITSSLAVIDYRTLGVLIRIATGMLNKCNIPKDVKLLFHENMVKNLTEESTKCALSVLPF